MESLEIFNKGWDAWKAMEDSDCKRMAGQGSLFIMYKKEKPFLDTVLCSIFPNA